MDPKNAPPPYPSQPGYGYPPQPGYPQQQPYPPPPAGYAAPQGPPSQGFGQGYGPPQQAGYGFPPQQGMGAPMGGMMGGNMAARQMMQGGYDSDAEGGYGEQEGMAGFDDKAVRRGFIRKVYGILMIQLLVTASFIAAFLFVRPIREFAYNNRYLMYIAMGVTFVCMIAMACCESVRRKSPTNFIFLGIFTVCEGFLLGCISSAYGVEAVMIAVGITCGVTLGLTIFAFQTKYDFTTCGGMLCAMVMILMLAGIIMAFMPYNRWAMIGYGSAGALIFSMYIVYDTQLMMGGKHKYSLSPEEYIFAALNIYLDVINLFLYILMIVGAAKSD